jgi:acetyl esterase/lipase
MQLMKSLRIIKELSNETTINSDKITIMGFSAGGHLASLLGENWNNRFFIDSDKLKNKYYKPSSLVLCYPVITTGKYKYQPCFSNLSTPDKFKSLLSIENNVSNDFPPTFIWHTEYDSVVDVHNSLLLVHRLIDAGVPCEFHMYERGCHGMGIVSKETTPDSKMNDFSYDAASWTSMAARWIHSR